MRSSPTSPSRGPPSSWSNGARRPGWPGRERRPARHRSARELQLGGGAAGAPRQPRVADPDGPRARPEARREGARATSSSSPPSPGRSGSPRSSLYSATKFGLRGFAFGLREDMHPNGVGVSIVSPGFVREAGMFHDAGSKPPPGLGTTTPEKVAEGGRHAPSSATATRSPWRRGASASSRVRLPAPGVRRPGPAPRRRRADRRRARRRSGRQALKYVCRCARQG